METKNQVLHGSGVGFLNSPLPQDHEGFSPSHPAVLQVKIGNKIPVNRRKSIWDFEFTTPLRITRQRSCRVILIKELEIGFLNSPLPQDHEGFSPSHPAVLQVKIGNKIPVNRRKSIWDFEVTPLIRITRQRSCRVILIKELEIGFLNSPLPQDHKGFSPSNPVLSSRPRIPLKQAASK